MNSHSLDFFTGVCMWEIQCQLILPLKAFFILRGDSGIIAELVAGVLLFPVTEGTKGVGAQGNVIGSSLPG